MWAAYWYNGRIYTTDTASRRGLGVYALDGFNPRTVFSFPDRHNPSTQTGGFG